MYLPYGVNENGQLVYIDQVGRGKTSLCCPYCGVKLVARKGIKLAPHFAHDGATCRQVKRAEAAFALPVYDSFRLHLTGRQWEALRDFHDEADTYGADELEQLGFVKSFISPYGNQRYNLTHKGKIPFGELLLNLFNEFQAPLIEERYAELEVAALAALCTTDEETAVTDLKLFRAQVKRILDASLYFVEVRTEKHTFHKIGVTTRPIEQRLAEIRADLIPHFGSLDILLLGTWSHRGNVELYFKHRYRRFQHPIGTLTEYFMLDDAKSVLRDLRRMKPKELSDIDRAIMHGELTRAERKELNADEILSREAWALLYNFSSEAARNNYAARFELQSYRLGNRTHPMVEWTQVHPFPIFTLTDYGLAYRSKFASLYNEIFSQRL